jgi:hypothetical protein
VVIIHKITLYRKCVHNGNKLHAMMEALNKIEHRTGISDLFLQEGLTVFYLEQI